MAIDNLPLFSAMNREEVKPPFPHPQRPLTSQEAHFAIMEKVNACIAEVNHFEQRVRCEMEQFIARTETENTGFKEAIQASYNAFMETIQREINNFEADFQNNFDLYRNDIDKRVADFQTAINNEFETLQTNVLKASNDKISEMEDLKITLNNNFTQYKAVLNDIVNVFKTQVNDILAEQNKKIEEYKQYMVDNLPKNVRNVFEQKVRTGEITEIMQEVYGESRTFKGAITYDEMQSLTSPLNGDYYYCTTDEHYYQYSDSGWIDIGNGEKIYDDYEAYKLVVSNKFDEISDDNVIIPNFYTGRFVTENGYGISGYWNTTLPYPIKKGEEIEIYGICPYYRLLNADLSYYENSFVTVMDVEREEVVNYIKLVSPINGFIQLSYTIRVDSVFYQNPDTLKIVRGKAINTLKNNTVSSSHLTRGCITSKNFGGKLLSKINEESVIDNKALCLDEDFNAYLKEDETYCVSDFIEVKGGEQYWIKYAYPYTMFFYDDNKNFIRGLVLSNLVSPVPVNNIAENVVFTTPLNCKYIRYNSKYTHMSLQCVGYGDLILTDEEIEITSSLIEIPYLKVRQTINTSNWCEKNFITLGDSITAQDGKPYTQGDVGAIARGYQTIIKENLGFKNYTNKGVSGRPISNGSVNGDGTVETGRNIDYTQYDLCIIAGGTNDFKLNMPLGELKASDFDETTFYGAYQSLVETILTSNQLIRLCLFTPLQRDHSGYDIGYVNTAGYKLRDYVEAIEKIGEKYSLPVCDLYRNSGITKLTLNTFTMDGLHPNDVGYKRMGDYASHFINGIGV